MNKKLISLSQKFRSKFLLVLVVCVMSLTGLVVFGSLISGSFSTGSSMQVTVTKLTLNKPTSAVGDILIASVAINGGSSAVVTPPVGWNQILRTDNDTNVTLISYWKSVGINESSSYTWVVDGQTTAQGGIVAYTGVDAMNPIDDSAGNIGYSIQATSTPINASAANEMVYDVFVTDIGKQNKAGAYFSTPTGMNEKFDSTNSPFGPSIAVSDVLQVPTGVVNSKSTTITGNKPRNWSSQQITLRPTPTPGITFDSSANTTVLSDTTGSLNLTTSGLNRMLVVSITNPSAALPASVTYNGVPLTMAVGDVARSIWYLINPDLGTHQVVVDFSSNQYFSIMALSLNGVNQSVGIGSVATASDGNLVSSGSINITTQASGSWIVDVLGLDNHGGDNDPISTGVNQIRRNKTFINAAGNYWNGAQSTETTLSAGNYSLNYSWIGEFSYSMAAVEILPAN